jgi:hypothetical protein
MPLVETRERAVPVVFSHRYRVSSLAAGASSPSAILRRPFSKRELVLHITVPTIRVNQTLCESPPGRPRRVPEEGEEETLDASSPEGPDCHTNDRGYCIDTEAADHRSERSDWRPQRIPCGLRPITHRHDDVYGYPCGQHRHADPERFSRETLDHRLENSRPAFPAFWVEHRQRHE